MQRERNHRSEDSESKSQCRVQLEPLGRTIEVARGTSLQEVLLPFGLEFPCGGRGLCHGCRVKVLQGTAPASSEDEANLTAEQIEEGWRLACQCLVLSDLKVEFAQWTTVILSDDSNFSFTPGEGLGVCVDLGTTTIVAQLLDLATGQVLAVKTSLNPQARYGADVMSRIQHALDLAGRRQLVEKVRGKIYQLLQGLLDFARLEEPRVRKIKIVGNTVMHHLFCDVDVKPLALYPFEVENGGERRYRAEELGWEISGAPEVSFLPCLGGFVGSDLLVGILATRLWAQDEVVGLIDLGTNGEIVFGNRDRILCASTAAGPAFEGAGITWGMRASTGAIWKVTHSGGQLNCSVLGCERPRGICGSGLVDAVACGLDLDVIQSDGRFSKGTGSWVLQGPVFLAQCDIRELQLAKGAIAAGIQVLRKELGLSEGQPRTVYLAGAFGNYIDLDSARRIGLFGSHLENACAAGNTALLGAKMSLFNQAEEGDYDSVRKKVRHIPLAASPDFQEIFVQQLHFPTRLQSGRR